MSVHQQHKHQSQKFLRNLEPFFSFLMQRMVNEQHKRYSMHCLPVFPSFSRPAEGNYDFQYRNRKLASILQNLEMFRKFICSQFLWKTQSVIFLSREDIRSLKMAFFPKNI